MSLSKSAVLAIGAGAIVLGGTLSHLVAAPTPTDTLGNLGNHEGILVDVKTFQISKGQAKGDPAARIVKLGAKEVSEGAIIFRVENKLYIVDGKPLGSGPQAMREMPSTIDGFNELFTSN